MGKNSGASPALVVIAIVLGAGGLGLGGYILTTGGLQGPKGNDGACRPEARGFL